MRLWLIIGIIFGVPFLVKPSLAEDKGENEYQAIKGMMLYCLPAVVSGENAADVAVKQNLKEFPPDRAKVFGQEARVFAIPEQIGNAVLIARSNGICSVSIREIDDSEIFWEIVDKWFGSETPFELKHEEEESNALHKSYVGDFSGNIVVHVSTRTLPVKGSAQALLTASRFKN